MSLPINHLPYNKSLFQGKFEYTMQILCWEEAQKLKCQGIIDWFYLESADNYSNSLYINL